MKKFQVLLRITKMWHRDTEWTNAVGNDAVNMLDAELTQTFHLLKKKKKCQVKFWSVLCVEGQVSTPNSVFFICKKMQYTALIWWLRDYFCEPTCPGLAVVGSLGGGLSLPQQRWAHVSTSQCHSSVVPPPPASFFLQGCHSGVEMMLGFLLLHCSLRGGHDLSSGEAWPLMTLVPISLPL